MKKKIDYITKVKIAKLYEDGEHSTKIASVFNLTPTTILKIAREQGVKIRTSTEHKKIYFYNDDFFENINTEEKAYWYGFILADGCISRDKDLIIKLNERDKIHLEKFVKSIGGNNQISIIKAKCIVNGIKYNDSYQACLSIRSEKMVADLKKHGLTPNKSHLVKIPTLNDESLYIHFWRGVFDGDGHYSIYNQKNSAGKIYKILEFGLCGNINVISAFTDWINQQLNFNLNIHKDKSIFKVRCVCKKANKISNLFYKDAIIYLDRKLKKFKEYESFKPK